MGRPEWHKVALIEATLADLRAFAAVPQDVHEVTYQLDGRQFFLPLGQLRVVGAYLWEGVDLTNNRAVRVSWSPAEGRIWLQLSASAQVRSDLPVALSAAQYRRVVASRGANSNTESGNSSCGPGWAWDWLMVVTILALVLVLPPAFTGPFHLSASIRHGLAAIGGVIAVVPAGRLVVWDFPRLVKPLQAALVFWVVILFLLYVVALS